MITNNIHTNVTCLNHGSEIQFKHDTKKNYKKKKRLLKKKKC